MGADLRLRAIEMLIEANAADAVLADREGDTFIGNAARLRMALRRFPLIILGGPDAPARRQ